jgi:hypothetical protein
MAYPEPLFRGFRLLQKAVEQKPFAFCMSQLYSSGNGFWDLNRFLERRRFLTEGVIGRLPTIVAFFPEGHLTEKFINLCIILLLFISE